jgi:hypothetical protein
MARYFAIPVLAVMLSLVGLRWLAAPAPRLEEAAEIVVSLPAQEPEAPRQEAPAFVTPQDLWEAPAPAPVVTPAPRIEAAAPVAIEAPAPVVRTEVIERTVYVPQPTVIYAPTTIVSTAVAPPPEPRQETVETPVIILVAQQQGRHPQPPRRTEAQQDPFFKSIPFQPPTPRGPRWNP